MRILVLIAALASTVRCALGQDGDAMTDTIEESTTPQTPYKPPTPFNNQHTLMIPLVPHNGGVHYSMTVNVGEVYDFDLGKLRPTRVRSIIIDTASSDFAMFPIELQPEHSYDPFDANTTTTAKQISIVDSKGDTYKFSHQVTIDGYRKIFSNSHAFNDFVSLNTYRATVSSPPFELQVNGTIIYAENETTSYVNPQWPISHDFSNWSAYSGIFGLSHNLLAVLNSSFVSMMNKLVEMGAANVFSLDLRGGGVESSRLYMGGGPRIPSDKGYQMVWSERQPFDLSTLVHHTFPIFDLSVCGINMFGNFTSNYFAIIDTGGSCLGLPETFYEELFVWLGNAFLRDLDEVSKKPNWRPAVYLREDFPISSLPSITFKLSEDGPVFSIDLRRLVLPKRQVKVFQKVYEDDGFDLLHPMCIYNIELGGFDRIPGGTFRGNIQPPDLYSRKIVFGSLAVTALRTLVAFNLTSARVGLIHDPGIVPRIKGPACIDPDICVGGQTYFAPLNMCEDPSCDAYFLRALDRETMTCNTTIYAYLVGGVLLVLFVAVEVWTENSKATLKKRMNAVLERTP